MLKIDIGPPDLKVERGGRYLLTSLLAEDGDKMHAKRLLRETADMLQEGKTIPEVTRLVLAKHLRRIANSDPLQFFDYKNTNRPENRSQKIETFLKVEYLKEIGEASSIMKAAEILSETTYKTRTPEAIKKDYYRGKKLIQGLTEKTGTQRTF